MHEEFARGRDVAKRVEEGRAEWAELFEASEPLNTYTHFLQVPPPHLCPLPFPHTPVPLI